jgi:hypothetical protein
MACRWMAPEREWSAQGVRRERLRRCSSFEARSARPGRAIGARCARTHSWMPPGLALALTPPSRALRVAPRSAAPTLDRGGPCAALSSPYRQAQNACRPYRGHRSSRRVVAHVERGQPHGRGTATRPADALGQERRPAGGPQAERGRPAAVAPGGGTVRRRPVRCPWCFDRVDLVPCLEVRRRAMLLGQPIARGAGVIPDDHPGWWCPGCCAGGVLIKGPQ